MIKDEHYGVYYFYNYLEIEGTQIKQKNDVCTNNSPFMVCDAYSVNGKVRILQNWQTISSNDYKKFGEIIVRRNNEI